AGAAASATGFSCTAEVALLAVCREIRPAGHGRPSAGRGGEGCGARQHRQADFRLLDDEEALFLGFFVFEALFFGGSPRLSRSRSIRSMTPVISGSAASFSVTFFPFILAAMIFSRLARYWSVYFEGSNSSVRLPMSCSAIFSSWGR